MTIPPVDCFMLGASIVDHPPGGEGVGGGGYSVWKKVPTAVRHLRNCGCRKPTWLNKEGGGAVQLLHPPKEGPVIALDVDILEKL